MKANKALKRLTQAEDVISDVMERYPAGSIQQQLLDAKAAVGRAKDAIVQASSRPKKAAAEASSEVPPAKPETKKTKSTARKSK